MLARNLYWCQNIIFNALIPVIRKCYGTSVKKNNINMFRFKITVLPEYFRPYINSIRMLSRKFDHLQVKNVIYWKPLFKFFSFLKALKADSNPLILSPIAQPLKWNSRNMSIVRNHYYDHLTTTHIIQTMILCRNCTYQ